MSTELNVIPSSALTEQEQADLNASCPQEQPAGNQPPCF